MQVVFVRFAHGHIAKFTDREPAAMTDPDELAGVIAMLIGLSNTASVAEFAVNCQLEEQY